ncbi:MAG: imidazole glycerol phosphate synthase subunit HisH [Actinomycetes bacterium]|nr:MAG: imidazole glycerol phosphate synthase subunit HisH [Actinomycetota bacterium]
MSLVVVPTGTANLASVLAGLRRLGADPVISRDPEDAERAGRVVLPGVGTFGAAMAALDGAGMTDVLRDRVTDGRPTLCVCVGMQVLAATSEESPGKGLGVVDAEVRRFRGAVRVPQLGWNRVEPEPGCRFVTPGWAYFANSYRLDEVPEGWVGAGSDHGGPFVAAMERGDVLACQFHPELSGPWGLAVLERWLGR